MVQEKFIKTSIDDCFVSFCNRYYDNRGFFQEIYNDQYDFLDFNIKQSNWSVSNKNVLRGIHCSPYSKLVTCVKGSILDIVIDLRKTSPTYKKHFLQELSDKNGYQIFIPANCGHGFLSLEDLSTVVYFQDGLYKDNIDKEKSYSYNSFDIKLPSSNYTLSLKDAGACIYEF